VSCRAVRRRRRASADMCGNGNRNSGRRSARPMFRRVMSGAWKRRSTSMSRSRAVNEYTDFLRRLPPPRLWFYSGSDFHSHSSMAVRLMHIGIRNLAGAANWYTVSKTQSTFAVTESNDLPQPTLFLFQLICSRLTFGTGARFRRKGLKGLAFCPEPVKQHGKLSGNGRYGSLLSVCSTPDQPESPSTQRRIRAQRSEDVMGALHKRLAKIAVSSFRYPELRVPVARLRALRP
jgi:hypothetical protein